ncbi:MAG: F0F1 ATP synthase subunit A [Phycisphaerales bacterium]|nr:MAG: F0F1 ATP synthase subunit A [Phycisphaerales bacterium]
MTGLLGAGSSPLDHVVQWEYVQRGGLTLLSNQIAMQILAAVLLILLFPRLVRLASTGDTVRDLTPRGFGNFIETICNYLRNEVARPALERHTDRFIPYIWSAFFYVLFCNLLGLLPLEPLTRPLVRAIFPHAHHGIGGSATGNIWVTGTLASCTMVMIVFNGLRIGGVRYLAHFCPGPLWLAPLLVPVEIIGLVAKIFALCVRLFANMVAGHVLLAVLLSFIFVVGAESFAGGLGVGVLVVSVSVAFYMLEIFVAFLQAFIFTFLTTLFIGQAIVLHHSDHEGDHGRAKAAHE